MIWFNCKKCGKTHGRAENSAGTMIFCDCGHGNTVPWESSAQEPPPMPVVAAPKVPDLNPIQFEPVSAPSTPAPAGAKPTTTYPTSSTSPSPSAEDEERSYRRGRTEKRDPDYCFNHQRRPKVQACTDCEEGFCSDCLVKFQGAYLCSPCKNFRARRQELPPAASTMASASLIISLMAGPFMMCLLLFTPANSVMYVLSWLSLLPQVLALGLGVWALWEAEKEKKAGGQWIAISGVATATLTCVLMLLLQMVAGRLVV